MRVLHVVKTSDGARWAVRQVGALAELGVDVHVALPSAVGQAGERIIFAARYPADVAPNLWREFDVAVYVPTSENCGGVLESLLHQVPAIASKVGGLPEAVIHGVTGWLVPPRDPPSLARAVLEVLEDGQQAKLRPRLGSELVRTMFDPMRTAEEVAAIYHHIPDSRFPAPESFYSAKAVVSVGSQYGPPHGSGTGGAEACTAPR